MAQLVEERPVAGAHSLSTEHSLSIEPARKMRRYLQRARAEGKSFEAVWQFAILNACHGLERGKYGGEHGEWVSIFTSTRSIWRSAFYREPDIHALDWLGQVDEVR